MPFQKKHKKDIKCIFVMISHNCTRYNFITFIISLQLACNNSFTSIAKSSKRDKEKMFSLSTSTINQWFVSPAIIKSSSTNMQPREFLSNIAFLSSLISLTSKSYHPNISLLITFSLLMKKDGSPSGLFLPGFNSPKMAIPKPNNRIISSRRTVERECTAIFVQSVTVTKY